MQHTFEIQPRHTIDLRRTVLSHGWVELAPWSWDRDAGELSRPDAIDGRAVTIRVRPLGGRLLVGAEGAPVAADRIAARVRRWLSLDWDPSAAIAAAERIEPAVAEYLRAGGRILCGSTFYEDFLKTICTVNASWAFSKKMAALLVEEVGGGLFPTPAAVLYSGADDLTERVRMGYRARVVVDATAHMLERGMIDEDGEERGTITAEALLEIRGVGPYAAAHTLMLLHDYSRIPIDSVVRTYCREHLQLEEAEISDHFERWGEFRYLGYKVGRILRRES